MGKDYKDGLSRTVFVPLKYDFVFREVFSNERILRRFISDVTGIPLDKIKAVRVVSPFLWKRYRRQKQGILDVALIMNDDTCVDIEMQVRQQKYWVKRNLFYLAKMYTEDLKFGEKYEKLRKCIAISILDFDLIPGDDYHSVYSLRDRDGKEFTDLFEVHIIELNKKLRDEDVLGEWIRLFNADTRSKLDQIDAWNAEVREAMEMVRTMNLSRSLRMMYEAHLKAVRDRWAEDEYVKDLGRAEGRAEGEALAVLKLLERFGDMPPELRDRVMAQKDSEVLNAWLMVAAGSDSLHEFREQTGL